MSGCTATIDINIKLSTRTTQIRDKYVKVKSVVFISFLFSVTVDNFSGRITSSNYF